MMGEEGLFLILASLMIVFYYFGNLVQSLYSVILASENYFFESRNMIDDLGDLVTN